MAQQGKISSKLVLEGASKYNSDLKSIQSSLSNLRSEFKVCQAQYATTQNSAEALAAKEAIITKQYEEAHKKVEVYTKAISEATEYKKRLADQITEEIAKNGEQSEKLERLRSDYNYADAEILKYTTYLNNATAEELTYNNQLRETQGYLEEARGRFDKCATSIDEFGHKTQDAEASISDIDKKLKNIIDSEAYSKIADAAEKMKDTLLECAEVAESFEYSMAKVQSIAQVSGSELESMSSEIRRVAAEMGYGASEIAEATYQAISASVDASEAVGFVENATQLARAGFTEAASAVDVLTTATNAYGKEANTTQHIADDLITTQNLGKTTVDELAQSLGTVIPTASAYNVSLDQLSSAYVILTRNGINTANATTYLSGMMTELADSGSTVGEILYNKTGKSFGELMQAGYSLGDVMQILGTEVDGNTEAFANLFSNVRAGRGALNIFNAGADEFNSVMSAMENNTGATTRAFETMADTAEMTNQKFNASVENLQIAIGESLSPTIQKIKELGIEALQPIIEFVEEHPVLVAAIAGATVAVTTATAAISALAVATAVCKAVFGDVSGLVIVATAGLVAAAGGITGAVIAATSATSEVDKLTASLQNNIDTTKELNSTYGDGVDDIQRQSGFVDELKNKIISLNNQESLTKAQKYELKTAVNELNSMYGNLNLQIDAQTGKLSENSEGWIKNLEAQQRAEQAKYMQEALSEIYEQQAENAYAVWEAEQDLTDIENEKAAISEQLIELQERQNDLNSEELAKMRDLYDRGAELEEQENTLKDSKSELNKAQADLTETYDSLVEYMQEEMGITEDATEATDDLTQSVGEAAGSYLDLEEAQKAVEAATDQATGAIERQTGILDEWNDKAQATFTEMQDIWASQSEGLDQYNEDLAYIKTLIDSDTSPAVKDLATQMVELDDAATLHEFVAGLQDAGTNIDELAAQWQELIDKKSAAEDVYASIILQDQGYVDQSSELFQNYYDDMTAAREAHNSLELTAAEDHKDELVTNANDTVQSMADAVTDQTAAALVPAVDTLATDTISAAKSGLEIEADGKSGAFYRLGSDGICGGLASGISAGSSRVKSAIDAMIQSAVSSVDVSGIVSQIDQRLGEVMGG